MRTKMTMDLVCSRCGEVLECDSTQSKFECHSAFDQSARWAIKPCKSCMRKIERPLALLKGALKEAEAIDL